MRPSVRHVHHLTSGISPFDDLEADHRATALRWIESTDDIYRRAKPATPSPHLVSYAVVVDPTDGSVLLVDHVNAQLWLPTGGHVEVDEDPADAAAREVHEELGIEACFSDSERRPAFVTVTETVGVDSGHVDVSLWFVLMGSRQLELVDRSGEFAGVRWWDPGELENGRFDPHFGRFCRKVAVGTGVRLLGRTEFTAIPQERHAEVSAGIRRLEQ
jgi:8-oxo-dGTP diphosphatase